MQKINENELGVTWYEKPITQCIQTQKNIVGTMEAMTDQSLDKMEEEMYDLMCRIAMEEGKELPTVDEFYEWLNEK